MRPILRSLAVLAALAFGTSAFAAAPRQTEHRWKNQYGYGLTRVELDGEGRVQKTKTISARFGADGRVRNLKSVTELPQAHYRMSDWQARDHGVRFSIATQSAPGQAREWKREITLKNGFTRLITSKDRPGAPPRYVIANGMNVAQSIVELVKMAKRQKRPIATWVGTEDVTIHPRESADDVMARIPGLVR